MRVTCKMMLLTVLIESQSSVFQGAAHLGTVYQSSSDCDDGWVPGTLVGYVCKGFDKWQLEPSYGPIGVMLQQPKLKYMPVNGWLYPSSSLIFEVRKEALFSVGLIGSILHKTQ